MKVVREFAPAKVNLGLAVLGRREDGYHEIESLMATLDVGDDIEAMAAASGVELAVEGADLPAGPDNLAYRAAERYLAAAGHPGGVSLRLVKRLPVAAGLGGGSSDAAAVLRALGRLYPAGVDLLAVAAGLGADVPFLVRGGAAVASGIGERLVPIELPQAHLVLANPGVGISAADAYRGLAGRFGPPLEVQAILAALGAGGAPPYRNDLEAPVLESYPLVAEVKRVLREAGLRGVLMSGSGSTVFGLAEDAAAAEDAAERVRVARPDWWVRGARTAG